MWGPNPTWPEIGLRFLVQIAPLLAAVLALGALFPGIDTFVSVGIGAAVTAAVLTPFRIRAERRAYALPEPDDRGCWGRRSPRRGG